MWDRLNTTFRWVVIAAILGGAVWITVQVKSCSKPEVATNLPGLPIEIKKPISENSPLVPTPKKKQGGVLTIIRKPKPTLEEPLPKPDTITVLIPREPRETPPSVFGDSGSYSISYTPIRAPYVELLTTYHAGISIDTQGKLSPWGGVGLVSLFEVGSMGLCADRGGLGAFLGGEVNRLALSASYRVLRMNPDGSRFALSLSYRF